MEDPDTSLLRLDVLSSTESPPVGRRAIVRKGGSGSLFDDSRRPSRLPSATWKATRARVLADAPWWHGTARNLEEPDEHPRISGNPIADPTVSGVETRTVPAGFHVFGRTDDGSRPAMTTGVLRDRG